MKPAPLSSPRQQQQQRIQQSPAATATNLQLTSSASKNETVRVR